MIQKRRDLKENNDSKEEGFKGNLRFPLKYNCII